MRRKLLILSLFSISILASGCTDKTATSTQNTNSDIETSLTTENSNITGETTSQPSYIQDDTFNIVGTNVEVIKEQNIYKISKGGSYTLSGLLNNGEIIINTSEDDEVTLILDQTSISCDFNTPIFCISADKLSIITKGENYIFDNRAHQSNEDEDDGINIGSAAIYANCDITFKGNGNLVINGNYKRAIDSKDEIKIKDTKLKATSNDTAIKANDGFNSENSNITLNSIIGDGIKTSNSEYKASKNKQKGSVSIDGGILNIYSACDGIDAIYNIILSNADLNIFTGEYSNYNKDNIQFAPPPPGPGPGQDEGNTEKSSNSTKGLKAHNEIIIESGNINIKACDDTIHATYGESLDNGSKGTGNVTINGGNINLFSLDDAIHADQYLNINGGLINIEQSYEGIESNIINVNDGTIYIYSKDDGVNAAKKAGLTPEININGGLIDITVSNGDVDGIDSNGSYNQTSGIVISRSAPGGNNRMATCLDCDGVASITGGTFIAIGSMESTLKYNNSVLTANLGRNVNFLTGNYEVSKLDIKFELTYSYKGMTIFSSNLKLNESYSLIGPTSKEWTQNSQNINI